MTKIALLGDIHIRKTPPLNRIDDFEKTLEKKFIEVLETCKNEGVELILQPGDLFDSSRVPYSVLSKYLKLINQYEIKWAVVYGQHDQRFHSSEIENTPLNILINTPNVTRLKRNRPLHFGNCSIWGASWNEKFPEPKNLNSDCNILVAHTMVVDREKLWSGQTDFMYARELTKKYPFNIFVLGDNHTPFFHQSNNKTVINCGSLTRQSIDQNHIPMFYTFDDETFELKEHLISIDLVEEVFNYYKFEETKQRNEEIESFVEQLKGTYGGNLNFKENLQNAMKENNIDSNIRSIIEEALPNE